jgi:hypothetical protein
MAGVDDLDQVIEQYHRAAAEFIKGNPEPYKMVFSHQEDVSLANPFGPVARGWKQVAETMERAASLYRDGEITGFENIAKYVLLSLPTSWRKNGSGRRLAEGRRPPRGSADYEHTST